MKYGRYKFIILILIEKKKNDLPDLTIVSGSGSEKSFLIVHMYSL